jgi:hypothetical protein
MSDQVLENFKTGGHIREQPRRNLAISAHSSASETVENHLFVVPDQESAG